MCSENFKISGFFLGLLIDIESFFLFISKIKNLIINLFFWKILSLININLYSILIIPKLEAIKVALLE